MTPVGEKKKQQKLFCFLQESDSLRVPAAPLC